MVTTPSVWILRTRAQDPCSCCCRPGVGLRPAADHLQKWLRRLAFGILRTRAQDPCSCCCRPGQGLRPAADHPQKWLGRLAFWILRTRAQDPCSCCCRPGLGLRPAADHPQMVTTPGVLDPADPRARSLQLLLDISDRSG